MTRIKSVSREKYRIFLDRSNEYYKGMLAEYREERRNNAATFAVHSIISLVDSFTVLKLGERSSDKNHVQAIILLQRSKSSNEPEKSRVCGRILELIDMKTPTEYEDRELSKADADTAIYLCEKIRNFLLEEIRISERSLAK